MDARTIETTRLLLQEAWRDQAALASLARAALRCPFPLRINKHLEALEQHTRDWMARSDIHGHDAEYQRFHDCKITWICSAMYPVCDLRRLKVVGDWLSMIVLWDDLCDRPEVRGQPMAQKAQNARLTEILGGAAPRHGDTPYARALYDLRQQTRSLAEPRWIFRFTREVAGFFDSCAAETDQLARQILPSLEEYSKLRRITGIVIILYEMILLADDLALPDEVREHPLIRQLEVLTNDHITLTNDVFSVYKELACGDVHNYVTLLACHEGLSFRSAMERAVERCNEMMDAFLKAEACLPSFGATVDAQCRRYVEGLRSLIVGHLRFYDHTSRYEVTERPEHRQPDGHASVA